MRRTPFNDSLIRTEQHSDRFQASRLALPRSQSRVEREAIFFNQQRGRARHPETDSAKTWTPFQVFDISCRISCPTERCPTEHCLPGSLPAELVSTIRVAPARSPVCRKTLVFCVAVPEISLRVRIESGGSFCGPGGMAATHSVP